MTSLAKTQASHGSFDKVLGAAAILALLYFAREVLVPVTLAVVLSIFVAPLVRSLRRLGLGHASSVAAAVLALAAGLSLSGLMIGTQLIRLGSSLPQYEGTLREKLVALDELTVGRLGTLTGQADRMISKLASGRQQSVPGQEGEVVAAPMPVEIHQPQARPIELLRTIINTVSHPLATAGMVFVVLIFVLLEHEALRDRFIRLVGSGNLRATTNAFNDAAARLSRFFISQLAVNVAVGGLIWGGLAVTGLPQAFLWGAMATLFRFIPYIGIWIAALCATILAIVIAPGWTLALATLALFVAVDIIVSQLVEPHLYGHSTGLTPLSVVIAAVFWGWLWGPVGLVLSTPLTLCLVVAGHHIRSLHFLEIILGEIPALTLPENLYQRALAGDDQEILAAARRFLRGKPLTAYCDSVLVPAFHLAISDFAEREITQAEQVKVNNTIASVLIGLDGRRSRWRPTPRISVLEGTTAARKLRDQRERQMGQWQGPLDVPAGTVVLAIGAGSLVDELAAEVLVRVLRGQNLDGRHLALADLEAAPSDAARTDAVAAVCLVSLVPLGQQILLPPMASFRERFPNAKVLFLQLPDPFGAPLRGPQDVIGADHVVHSYREATELCSHLLRVPVSTGR